MKVSAITIALAAALLSQTTAAASVSSTTTGERGALGDGGSRRPLSFLGNTSATSAAGSSLNSRDDKACVTGFPYGCDGGYCWKVCDSVGGWCWTAKDGGTGDWETCSTFRDCNTDMACGIGNCASCGCSC
ncbi:hypothetical protein BDZ94DRAFT_533415 [Collybia nuda]|uniref:Allergenic protein Tha p 2 n=1 Tax=Collybia nuda TaxID=64659 RepID=A0A9P5Y5N2_9AGAR|nr:hypothetical protein BDZ94DRAFT_533415 [Collybia nuda]